MCPRGSAPARSVSPPRSIASRGKGPRSAGPVVRTATGRSRRRVGSETRTLPVALDPPRAARALEMVADEPDVGAQRPPRARDDPFRLDPPRCRDGVRFVIAIRVIVVPVWSRRGFGRNALASEPLVSLCPGGRTGVARLVRRHLPAGQARRRRISGTILSTRSDRAGLDPASGLDERPIDPDPQAIPGNERAGPVRRQVLPHRAAALIGCSRALHSVILSAGGKWQLRVPLCYGGVHPPDREEPCRWGVMDLGLGASGARRGLATRPNIGSIAPEPPQPHVGMWTNEKWSASLITDHPIARFMRDACPVRTAVDGAGSGETGVPNGIRRHDLPQTIVAICRPNAQRQRVARELRCREPTEVGGSR